MVAHNSLLSVLLSQSMKECRHTERLFVRGRESKQDRHKTDNVQSKQRQMGGEMQRDRKTQCV